MGKKRMVLLLSGGLDSTVLLWWAMREGWEVWPLSIHYGQRHARELDAMEQILTVAEVVQKDVASRSLIVDMKKATEFVFEGSSQTGDAAVPEGHYAAPSMRVTVVPNRNMVMLSMATALAQSSTCGADAVAYAAHSGDHAIYPDCRPEFVAAMSQAMGCSGYYPVELWTPFIRQTKKDIALLGKELGAPLHLTYSCYKGAEKHCGKCGTCVERREAFLLANLQDPTEYAQ